MKTSFTIAVDGPAAAGKGTISKAIAAHFDLPHLDTGLLYRAVGAKVLKGSDPVAAAHALTPDELNCDNLRSPKVADAASKVAVISEVRAALTEFQRSFARRIGGAVLDGRDIGTVICPEAEVKLFVTANAEIRAERRYLEMLENGLDVTRAGVFDDVIARDMRDMNREKAPLKPAMDAVVIDTSEMDIDSAVAAAIAEVNKRVPAD